MGLGKYTQIYLRFDVKGQSFPKIGMFGNQVQDELVVVM